MLHRVLALTLGVLVVPVSAAAQDTSAPAPTPTPTAVRTSPAIPSDFRIDGTPSRRTSPAEGPTLPNVPAPSVPAPTVTNTPAPRPSASAAPQQVQPRTAQQAQPAARPTAGAAERQPEPASATVAVPSPERDGAQEGPAASAQSVPDSVSDTAAGESIGSSPVAGPPSTAMEPTIASEGGEGGGNWLVWLLALLLAAVAGYIGWRWLQARQTSGVAEIERPEPAGAKPEIRPEPLAKPRPQPRPEPRPVLAAARQVSPEPVATPKPLPESTIGSLVTQRAVNPATLVSTAPRRNPQAPPSAPGLVTTNLAEKRRAEAEAVERARREALRRQAAVRPQVNRKISFDWS